MESQAEHHPEPRIRWEYYSVITEAHDRMTIFDPTCTRGVLPGTNTPVPNICPKGAPAYFPSYRNFDPRVGVSWAPGAFHDKPNNWVNIAAFAQPPQDANGVDTHFGDARNGIVRAPNVWEADIALQKSTKLGEKTALEFRTEAFNIFNHRQLGDPSHLDILSSSNFGQIDTPVSFNPNNDNFVEPATGLGLPRTLQLSFRVRF